MYSCILIIIYIFLMSTIFVFFFNYCPHGGVALALGGVALALGLVGLTPGLGMSMAVSAKRKKDNLLKCYIALLWV